MKDAPRPHGVTVNEVSASDQGVWPAGSALDDVVHRGNLWLAGIGSERRHDRQQRLPEGLERFLGIPDVEHLNLAVGLEGDVVEPSCRGTSASRF